MFSSRLILRPICTAFVAFLLSGSSVGLAELRLYVAGGNAASSPFRGFVSTIRASDGVVLRTILLPDPVKGGHSIKVHPGARKAYATGSLGPITVLDPSSLRVLGSIPLPESSSYGLAFLPSGGEALVCVDAPLLRRIDATTDTVNPTGIALHGNPLDVIVGPSGRQAFAGCTDGVIDRIDLTLPTPAVSATVSYPLGSGGGGIQVLALSPDESLLYATDANGDRLRVLRSSDLTEVTPPSYPGNPTLWYPRSLSISGDGATAYVGNREGPDGPNGNSVLVLRLSDGAITGRVHEEPVFVPAWSGWTGTANPRTSVLTPDGSTLFVTMHFSDTVAAINTSDLSFRYMTVRKAPVGCTLADVAPWPGDQLASDVPAASLGGLVLLSLVLAAAGTRLVLRS